MKNTRQHHGKLAIKHDQIVGDLRGRIVKGDLGPGSRLPTRSDLIDLYGVSSVTIQRAFDRLILDGFVFSRGSQGTFVCDTPPHLFNYGMLFPVAGEPGIAASRYRQAMKRSAHQISRQRGKISFQSYYAFAPQAQRETLCRDVQGSRMAGLVIFYHASDYANTPVVEQRDMPRVYVCPIYDQAKSFPRPADSSLITLDLQSLFQKGLQCLVSKGRKRLAIYSMGPSWSDAQEVAVMARAAGLSVDPAHRLEFCPDLCRAAKNVTQLLMRQPADVRPDAIFVIDDNLVEDVTAGLKLEGVTTPGDLDVIAHCNYPVPPSASIPVTYLGFDCRLILQQCLEIIDARRAGQDTPPLKINVPAVFQHELTQHNGVDA